MEACAFDLYLTQIARLSRAQCVRVLALFKPAVDHGRTAAVIEDAVAPDTLLVTDANKAYQAFSRQQGILHQYVNVSDGERMRGAVHVQNVNGYHSRFHKWRRRFNGVATRYLPNYLGWRWAIDQKRICTSETLLRAAIGVFNT